MPKVQDSWNCRINCRYEAEAPHNALYNNLYIPSLHYVVMIKTFNYHFSSFLCRFPTFWPKDVPIVSVQIQLVGILDSVSWSIYEHLQLMCNVSDLCILSMCQQDVTAELFGCLHIFLFQDKGEAVEKSWSAPQEWHGSHGMLRRKWFVFQQKISVQIKLEKE